MKREFLYERGRVYFRGYTKYSHNIRDESETSVGVVIFL